MELFPSHDELPIDEPEPQGPGGPVGCQMLLIVLVVGFMLAICLAAGIK